MIEIKHQHTGAVLYTADSAGSLREAVEEAAKKGANLEGANLDGANLEGANLEGAYFGGANLGRAYFGGANLGRARIDWTSHDLVSAILSSAAGASVARRSTAGLILVSRDWCWNDFLALQLPEREWALDTLAGYVRDGDNAPEVLQEWARINKEAADEKK